MKKMRGGVLKPLEQTVDYIIYCGDSPTEFEVLLTPNTTVAGTTNNLALIGTFATASVYKLSKDDKIYHSQYNIIDSGIKSNDPTKLIPLTKDNAFLLLQKDLQEKISITEDVKNILLNIQPINMNEITFHDVMDDIRLKDMKECPTQNCNIKTQLFKIKVPMDKKELFKTTKPDKLPLEWTKFVFNNDIDNNLKNTTIFSGHRMLINQAQMDIFSNKSETNASTVSEFENINL